MGRPSGSTSGRVPSKGYPTVDPADGAFLAGFIEGEASFNITRQPRGQNHRCLMSLAVRDDDELLLRGLQHAAGLGTIVRAPARGTSRPQVAWNVSAKSDCARLVEILEVSPLRGRKSYEFAIWSAAVRWWIGADPTVTIRNRDWAAMRYLKKQLQDRRTFDPSRPPYNLNAGGPDPHGDWPGYIAGLLSADGCLAIVRNGRGFVPLFHITQRVDDLPLLEEIQCRLGAGHIYVHQQKHWAPAAQWIIRDSAGLARAVRFFNSTPPRGKRGREFEVWREAVAIYDSPLPRPKVRDMLAAQRETLASIRRYSAPGI